MLQQAIDFQTESDALYELLKPLSDADFERKTLFKDWTINTVLQHLHYFNYAADLSLSDEDGILALLGAFQSNVLWTVVSAFGLIFASVYSLWVIQKVFHGEFHSSGFDDSHLTDLSRREMIYYVAMMLGLIWMGMYPQSFLSLSAPVLGDLLTASETAVALVAGVSP